MNVWNVGIDANVSEPIDKWTGFRFYCHEVRLEVDHSYETKESIKIVHNSGHGGSGWTVFIGASRAAASLDFAFITSSSDHDITSWKNSFKRKKVVSTLFNQNLCKS